jgi:hypothetical protein
LDKKELFAHNTREHKMINLIYSFLPLLSNLLTLLETQVGKVIQKSMFFGDITYLIWDKNCQKNLLISLALARTEKRIATRPPTNSNINDKVSLGKY